MSEFIARLKLAKQVSAWTVSNDTTNYFGYLCGVFVLNSHNITCWICTSISSILGTWDYRLNYDAHSITTEIRVTDEGNFNQVISGCV